MAVGAALGRALASRRRALAVVVALNRRLYGLLARRGGPSLLLGGLALHSLHQLAAIAALLAGGVAHLADRGRGR